MNDLTVSNIERQNVLNNKYAVAKIQDNLGIVGMDFEGEYRFTKKMVADFYEVDISTINRYLAEYVDDTSEKHKKMVDEIRDRFGLTSLKFNTIQDLVNAIGLPKEKLCTHCFDGSSWF